jgi:DNA-binding transcriptional LysR family regulator
VRLGTGATGYILQILLKTFHRVHPEVELLVEMGSHLALMERLASGDLDLALVVSAELTGSSGVSVEADWDYELVLVSPGRKVARQRLGIIHQHEPDPVTEVQMCTWPAPQW